MKKRLRRLNGAIHKSFLVLGCLFCLLKAGGLTAITSGLGTSLWQYDKSFYQSLDLIAVDSFDIGEHKLSYELYFPVIFASEPRYITIPAFYSNQKNNISFLSNLRYLPVYIPRLTYQKESLSFGVDKKDLEKKGDETIIRENFNLDAKAPFLQSELFFENKSAAFYLSSLNNPRLAMGIYRFSADEKTEITILKDFNFLSIAWLDRAEKKNAHIYGFASEMKIGAVRSSTWKTGMIFSGDYAYRMREDKKAINAYRTTGGIWLSTWDFTLDLALTYHEKNHPLGPMLSSVYSSRKLDNEIQIEKNFMGALFRIAPEEKEKTGFSASLETFFLPSRMFSLHIEYQLKVKDTKMYFGYTRENIANEKDLLSLDNKNSLLCFKLNSFLIGDFLKVNWQTYYNWREDSNLKSLISVSIYFR